MAAESGDPRRVTQSVHPTGLRLALQAAPPGAESFAATLVTPGGWAYDPEGREGTAILLSLLQPSGAGRWDRRALDRQLDRMGATLTRRCHPESSEVSVWGPRELWPDLLELLAAVVLEPRLETEDLERVRRQVYERQLRESSQPESRAETELARMVFPAGHPYRLSGLGTARSVRRLGRSELVDFHRRSTSREASLLVATGAPRGPEFLRALGRRWAEFPSERAPAAPRTPPVPRPTQRSRAIPLPGRAQVEIRVGGPSVRRSAPNYPGVFLANEVLGGRPLLSRLFQKVREAKGLAYHASSEFQAMRWGGYWVAGAGTGPERTEATERVVRAEVGRIATATVPSGELRRIRESAIGELPLALETTSGAHELAVDIAYHGLADDFLQTWPQELRAVTPRAVRQAAEEGLSLDGAVTVIAGPPAPPHTGRRRGDRAG